MITPARETPEAIDWKQQYHQLEANTKFATQLNSASIDCMIALDPEGNILYWNETCSNVCGMKFENHMGKSFLSVFTASAAHPSTIAALNQVKKGFKVFVPSEPDAWLPGYFELHLVPLKEPDGTINSIAFIAHDVAHRVLAEQQLKDLNRKLAAKYAQLERATATLATFSNITGHQFKEPLRKIYSTLERTVMEEGNSLMPKGRGALRKVQSSAQRLGLLADSLTTFSEARIEMVETVSLNIVMQQAAALLRLQIAENFAEITVGELPEVKGDSAQLKVLFCQLISNALKFQIPGNKPVINVSAKILAGEEFPAELAEKDVMYTVICVQDNGIGIPAADKERIFQIFEKGLGGGGYKGAGLGLALARKIAENHGGGLRVGPAPEFDGSLLECILPII